MLGTAAIIKTAALLTPLQVCGAATEPALIPTPINQDYDWATQQAVRGSDHDPRIKEGTATGSTPGNSLEDWND